MFKRNKLVISTDKDSCETSGRGKTGHKYVITVNSLAACMYCITYLAYSADQP